jgi:hypothetical protein
MGSEKIVLCFLRTFKTEKDFAIICSNAPDSQGMELRLKEIT